MTYSQEEANESKWIDFDNGKSVGERGSEDGIVVLDQRHTDGARITLENVEDTNRWAITCGVFGLFLHTVYKSRATEARQAYSEMKRELDHILSLSTDDEMLDAAHKFVSKF